MRPSTTVVCGVPIDDLTLGETVDRVCELVERGRATGRTHQVATINVDFVVNALADRSLLSMLQHADLAIPDGMPIVWGSRLLGSPLRERVAGVDLVAALAERCASSGYSMYLFGGAVGVAGRAADLLRARHHGLRITADSGPFFTAPQDMDREALERMEDAAPDILCVALGHPKQERWIEAYRRAIGVPVLIGVGGALDFLTGTTRRAPEWMQRGGVEWLHRATREPRRLIRRYARDAVRFGPSLLRDVVVTKGQAGGHAHPCQVQQVGEGVLLVRPHGRLHLTAATLGWTQAQWQDPPAGHHVVIDLAELSMLGHAELGAVVGFAKRLSDNGGRLTLSSVPSAVAKVILDLRLYDFLSTSSTALFDHVPSVDDVASATVPAAPGVTTEPSEQVTGERRMTNV